MKRLLFFTGISLLSIFSLLNLTASSDDSVDGEFTTSGNNNDVAIDEFDLKDSEGERTKTLSPQRNYTATIEVSDLDTIDDLYSLRIVFYNVKDGDDPETVFEDIEGTPDSGEVADFKWVRDGAGEDDPGSGSLSGSSFSGVKHEDHSEEDSIDDYTSWSVASSTTPDSDDADATSFTFELEFQVSKIAPESEGSQWRMGVETVDGWVDNGSSQPTTTVESLSTSQDDPVPGNVSDGDTFDMNWYGEIDVPKDLSIDWTDVKPEDDFSTPNSRFDTNEDNNTGIGYLSNGEHSREVYSSDTWTAAEDDLPDNVDGADLVSGDVSDPQTFGIALKTWDHDKTTRGYSEDGAERLQPSSDGRPSPLEIASSGRIDDDEAPEKQFNSFYLNVADEFQNAEYEGDITFNITNTDLVATTDSGDVTTGYRSIDEALNDKDAESLTLLDDIGTDTDEVDLTIDRPMDIDFDEYTLHGDLTVAYDDSVDTNFTGSGSLTGDLTVDTPDASFDSDLDVEGTTDVEAVSSNSFTTSGHHTGDINMRTSGSLTTEADASDATVNIVTGSAITLSGEVGTANVDTETTDLEMNASTEKMNVAHDASVKFANQADIKTIDIDADRTVTPDFATEGRISEKTGDGTLEGVHFVNGDDNLSDAFAEATTGSAIFIDGTHILPEESIADHDDNKMRIDTNGLSIKSQEPDETNKLILASSDESYDLSVEADDVTLEGFTILDHFSENGHMVEADSISGLTIQNIFFDNTDIDYDSVDNVIKTSETDGTTISGNDIETSEGSHAISTEGGSDYRITNNEIDNASIRLIGTDDSDNSSTGIEVSDNDIFSDNRGVILEGHQDGTEILDNVIHAEDYTINSMGSVDYEGAPENTVIKGNTLEGFSNTDDDYGIAFTVETDDDGTDYYESPVQATIENNAFVIPPYDYYISISKDVGVSESEWETIMDNNDYENNDYELVASVADDNTGIVYNPD